MLRVGMVGAENSHTVAIARVLNVDKKIPGVRATHVWGETRTYARDASERGEIPTIVRRAEETRVPLFVDKPFCYRKAEGRKFLARARQLKVPVCSFSTLPKQASFKQLSKDVKKLGKIQTVISTGPCDIKSKWGGIFFYGIHQVDMILRLTGYDFYRTQIVKGKGQNHSANILFRSGTVATMNLIGESRAAFHLSIVGEKGRIDREVVGDESMYLTGIKDFVRMFKTGKTDETDETMLGPVAVLESLEKSVAKPQARVGAGL